MVTLDIDELCLTVEATATPERANLLLRKVEQAVAERVPAALAAVADAAHGTDDAREVFIERLDVECDVSAGWDADAIARTLAVQVHRRLDVAPPAAFVVFHDRIEYVAALLAALADGVAGRRWWFDVEGLAALSISSALRTVMIDAGHVGVAALARLTPQNARRVVGTLNVGDAGSVLHWLCDRPGAAQAPPALLWNLAGHLHEHDDAGSWITALVDAERVAPGSTGACTRCTLEILVGLREALHRGAAAVRDGEDPRAALARWGGEGGRDPRWIHTLRPDDAAAIVREITAGLGSANRSAGTTTFHTRRAGAFLLRVLIARLGWIEAWARAQPDIDQAVLDTLAWSVAIKGATDPADVCEALQDPALRSLLPCRATDDDVQSQLARARIGSHAALARRLLRAFGCHLPGCARASAAYLRTNVLAFDAHVTLDDASLHVQVGRAPLDVLLALSGWKRTECTLADGRRLELRPRAS